MATFELDLIDQRTALDKLAPANAPPDEIALREVTKWLLSADEDDIHSEYETYIDRCLGSAAAPPSVAGPAPSGGAAQHPHSGHAQPRLGFFGKVMKKVQEVRREATGQPSGISAPSMFANAPDVRVLFHVAVLGDEHICDMAGGTDSRRGSIMEGDTGSKPASDPQLRSSSRAGLERGTRHERSFTMPAPPAGLEPPPRGESRGISAELVDSLPSISGGASAPSSAGSGSAAGGSPWALLPTVGPTQQAGGPRLPASMDPLPLRTPLAVDLTLTNSGKHKARVTVRPAQAFPGGHAAFISCEPSAVALRRGETGRVTVQVQLLQPGACVDAPLLIEVEGGLRQVVLVRARAEQSHFGLPLEEVPVTHSGGYAGIPVPLASLRDALLAYDGAALRNEGLFRLTPSAGDVRAARRALNDGLFTQTAVSPITTAHLIKLYLRELPAPLLNNIPTETLLAVGTEDEGRAAAGAHLGDAQLTVLQWLCDLLVTVAAREGENKMGARALATCVGPNLYRVDAAVNPMAALMASQKVVALLQKLVGARQAELRLQQQGQQEPEAGHEGSGTGQQQGQQAPLTTATAATVDAGLAAPIANAHAERGLELELEARDAPSDIDVAVSEAHTFEPA